MAPADDHRTALEEIARSIDRQLEGLRAVAANGFVASDDVVVADVRRSGESVASRCASLVLRASGEAAETARCLAAISALTLLVLEADGGDGTSPGPEGAPGWDADDARDVVRVLGDVVIERYRTLVRTAIEDPTAQLGPGLPIELFLRQLDELGAGAGSWQVLAIWTAMALKVEEATQRWPGHRRTPPDWEGTSP